MTEKRLSKTLAAAGIGSRRVCEEIILSGNVTVNDKTIFTPQTLVDVSRDKICVNQKLIKKEEKKIYYMLNKPHGFICSNKQVGSKKLVIDLFQETGKRIFTVGRLDRDTTGLLLVTNDGHFAQEVIHPSSNISKEYLVKTYHEISHEHLVAIAKGTRIEGKWVKPIKVTKVRKGTIKIVVKEGKKREVRLFVQNAGLKISSLVRIRIGGLILGKLEEGKWKILTEKEKKAIFQ